MTTTENTYETRYAEFRTRALAAGYADDHDLHAAAERYGLDTRRTFNPHRAEADGKLACRSCGEWDAPLAHEVGCDRADAEYRWAMGRIRAAARQMGEFVTVRTIAPGTTGARWEAYTGFAGTHTLHSGPPFTCVRSLAYSYGLVLV